MPDATFPFPGGKSRYAAWILDHVPDHECFLEVFGGAAGVLVNKDPDTSSVEVYNDADGDLVHFFEVLREQPDALVEWLDRVPYSRHLYNRWATHYYGGYRPVDDVERAGRFFFLRYAQWGGKYGNYSGFATSKTSSRALSYANKINRLEAFAERFDHVVIEHLDWPELLAKYDGPETVAYCDPPYVGKQDYYPAEDIDHSELHDALRGFDGYAICSYAKLPESAEGFHVVTREGEHRMINSGRQGEAKETVERLLLNFDPEEVLAGDL